MSFSANFDEVGDWKFVYIKDLTVVGHKAQLMIYKVSTDNGTRGVLITIDLESAHTKDPHKLAAQMYREGMTFEEIKEYFAL